MIDVVDYTARESLTLSSLWGDSGGLPWRSAVNSMERASKELLRAATMLEYVVEFSEGIDLEVFKEEVSSQWLIAVGHTATLYGQVQVQIFKKS